MSKVSVIVPIYNVERYLNRCIQTLVAQTYKNLEIILINDGSTDGSLEICKKWSEGDERIIVINQSNSGVSVARNAGLKVATGEYILFVDSDDMCQTDMVEILLKAIIGADLAYCEFFMDNRYRSTLISNPLEEGVYEKNEIYDALFFGSKNSKHAFMSTALWRGLFKKDVIDAHKIAFDPLLKFAEDWIFYAEYFKHIQRIKVVNKPLYRYSVRKSSATNTFNPTSEQGALKSLYILDKFSAIAKETAVEPSRYQSGLAKRYIGLVLMQSKNVWDKRNRISISKKISYLQWVCKEIRIADRIDKSDVKKLSVYYRLLYRSIRKGKTGLVSAHAIGYNLLRSMRNTMRGIASKIR